MKLSRNQLFSTALTAVAIIITIIFATGLKKNNQLTQRYIASQSEATTSSSSVSATSSTTPSSTIFSSSSVSATSSTTASNSSTSTTSSTITAGTDPVIIDVNDFISKYDNSELDTSLIYQFDAEPIWQEEWGLDADNKEYSMYIRYPNDPINYDFILFTTSSIANSIKNSKSATFTVKIDTSSTTYINPVRVISAVPKQ
ncbi:TPA: hypothetical protein U2B72_000057 [Streptococcus suis]|nr:hypothetical protein [Streptococcus suis]